MCSWRCGGERGYGSPGGAGGDDSGGQQDDDEDDDEDDHHDDHDQLGVLPPVGASHCLRRLFEQFCLRTTRQTGEATHRKQTPNSSTCPWRELTNYATIKTLIVVSLAKLNGTSQWLISVACFPATMNQTVSRKLFCRKYLWWNPDENMLLLKESSLPEWIKLEQQVGQKAGTSSAVQKVNELNHQTRRSWNNAFMKTCLKFRSGSFQFWVNKWIRIHFDTDPFFHFLCLVLEFVQVIASLWDLYHVPLHCVHDFIYLMVQLLHPALWCRLWVHSCWLLGRGTRTKLKWWKSDCQVQPAARLHFRVTFNLQTVTESSGLLCWNVASYFYSITWHLSDSCGYLLLLHLYLILLLPFKVWCIG